MILSWVRFNESLGFSNSVKWISDILFDKCIEILTSLNTKDEFKKSIVLKYEDLIYYIPTTDFDKFPVEEISLEFSVSYNDDDMYDPSGGYKFLSSTGKGSYYIESKQGLDRALHIEFYLNLNIPTDPDISKCIPIVKEAITHELTHAYEDYQRHLNKGKDKTTDKDQSLAISLASVLNEIQETASSYYLNRLFYCIYTITGIESRAIVGQLEPNTNLKDFEKSFTSDRLKMLEDFEEEEYYDGIIEDVGLERANEIVDIFISLYVKKSGAFGTGIDKKIINLNGKGMENFIQYWSHEIYYQLDKIKRRLYRKTVRESVYLNSGPYLEGTSITKEDESNLSDILQAIFDEYTLYSKSVVKYNNGDFVEYFVSYPGSRISNYDESVEDFNKIVSSVRNLNQRCDRVGFEYPTFYHMDRNINSRQEGYILQFKKIEQE